MKKRILSVAFAIIAIVGLTTITGCKKGENDPFLSLKSRKARVTGEWKLSQGTILETETSGGSTDTYVTTYTGSTCSSNGFTSLYTETLTINKNGTFVVAIVEDGEPYTIRGNWFFSGKSKDADLKNKEAIVLSETEYISVSGTTNYTGLYGDQVLLIDRLKNKEIIFKGAFSYTNNSGSSSSSSYDRTFEKK